MKPPLHALSNDQLPGQAMRSLAEERAWVAGAAASSSLVLISSRLPWPAPFTPTPFWKRMSLEAYRAKTKLRCCRKSLQIKSIIMLLTPFYLYHL